MYICNHNAVVAQLVEHQFPKLKVAGSNPVYRSFKIFMLSHHLNYLHAEFISASKEVVPAEQSYLMFLSRRGLLSIELKQNNNLFVRSTHTTKIYKFLFAPDVLNLQLSIKILSGLFVNFKLSN